MIYAYLILIFATTEQYACVKNIKPSLSKGQPFVADIKALQYRPNGFISYKLNFDVLPRRVDKAKLKETPLSLYSKQTPITHIKFQHLQELKATISAEYHAFYDKLSHESSKKPTTSVSKSDDKAEPSENEKRKKKLSIKSTAEELVAKKTKIR